MKKIAGAIIALLALGAAAPARTEDAETPLLRLRSAADPADRARACAELASPPHRGTHTYEVLSAAMGRDLSERVRLAAAVAVISFPGGEPLKRAEAFLTSEPGAEVRRELLLALSTEPAHRDNPDATRLIASLLSDDPSSEVRGAAASALGARGDQVARGAAARAAQGDKDKSVREAASRALAALLAPPKAKPRPKPPQPPKPDAVFGRDPCPPPWGWCACGGAIRRPPKCLTPGECRSLQADMRRYDLACTWDGHTGD